MAIEIMRVRAVMGASTLALALVGCPRPAGDEGGATAGNSSTGESTNGGTTGPNPSDSTGPSMSESTGSSTDESDTSTDESDTGMDGSDTSTDESDTGMDEETETETGSEDCDLNDVFEPNPSADEATVADWQSVDAYSAYRYVEGAYLCPGEDDWYVFDTDGIGFGEYWFYIRALIKDAGLCGEGCGDPVIPAGPMHAMTIDVHRADTMDLIGTSSSDDGVLWFNGAGGDAFAHDVLLHVYSATPDAAYPYRLQVSIRNYEGEDECEC